MTLATVAADTKAVDQRSRSANKASADRASADTQASTSDQNFDGVLSGLSDGSSNAGIASGVSAGPAGAKILLSKPTVDAEATALAPAGHDGTAITALVGKIIGSGAAAKPSDSAKASTKIAIATDESVPGATPDATQTVLPFDLAAFLATPLRAATPSQGIASPTPTKSSVAAGNGPTTPGAGVPAPATTSVEEATPTIANVSVDTSLAPWKDVATGLSEAKSADPAAATAGLPSMVGPIQTIADAVADLAGSHPADAPSNASESSGQTHTLAPARTLTLQLTPADLGTVAVRLHLTGNSLDVSLSVSDPKTLGLLGRDRDSLSTALGSQSYQLHSLVIQGADVSASGDNNAGHDDNRGTTHDNKSGNENQDSSGGRRGGDQPEARQQDRGAARASRARVSSGTGTSQLFV